MNGWTRLCGPHHALDVSLITPGQFKNSHGVIEQERSMLLILLYPVDTERASSRKIEQIRAIYERRFDQESVVRPDDPLPQCVSF